MANLTATKYNNESVAVTYIVKTSTGMPMHSGFDAFSITATGDATAREKAIIAYLRAHHNIARTDQIVIKTSGGILY